jgi:hypothetical protein
VIFDQTQFAFDETQLYDQFETEFHQMQTDHILAFSTRRLLLIISCELPTSKLVGFLLQRRAKLDEIKLNSPLHERNFGLFQP